MRSQQFSFLVGQEHHNFNNDINPYTDNQYTPFKLFNQSLPLTELEYRSAVQWGYSGEPVATTSPLLPELTSPPQDGLYYTQPPVTQTLQVP